MPTFRHALPILLLCATGAATAAPMTLFVDGMFSATSTNTASHAEFAKLVWGTAGVWSNGASAAARFEIDFDDTLTATPFNSTQSMFALETITGLRLQLGNVTLSSSGLAAASKIDFGLRDNDDVPDLLSGDGFALLMQQAWTRDSAGAYTLPGATEAVSGNGLYSYSFSALQATGGSPALEIRALKTADDKLAGGNPTGRFVQSGWHVAAAGDGGSVPEPGSLLLVALALALAAAAGAARRPLSNP